MKILRIILLKKTPLQMCFELIMLLCIVHVLNQTIDYMLSTRLGFAYAFFIILFHLGALGYIIYHAFLIHRDIWLKMKDRFGK